MSGKAYANRKKEEHRPEGDYYSTPKSLIWEMENVIKTEFPITTDFPILEPCAGQCAISEELKEFGYSVYTNDLYSDHPEINFHYDYINESEVFSGFKYSITNPPFSLWDQWIETSKKHCEKFMLLGRMNYLGTHGRNDSGLWDNLKAVYVFDRYVDYQTPYRNDGLFHVGALCTAWFLWDMDYEGAPKLKIIDVQKYAKLGGFKKNA